MRKDIEMPTLQKMPNVTRTKGIIAQCDNCRQRWTEAQLKDAKDIEERLEPGGEVPAGECPGCGALCYLIKKKVRTRAVVLPNEDGQAQSVLILPHGMTHGKAKELINKAWAEVKEKYQGNWSHDVLVKKLVSIGWVVAEFTEWTED